jgi:hypothetical protein
MMRTALVVACLVVASTGCALRHRGAATATPDPNTAAVYVFTAPRLSAMPVADQLERERVTALLTNYLHGKKRLTLVGSKAAANVLVEVQSAASSFSPTATGARFDSNALAVDITVKGRTTRLTESQRGQIRTAHKLAERIERWIQENRAAIVGERPGTE